MEPRKLLEQILETASRQVVETGEMAKSQRYYECHQDTDEIIQYRHDHDMPDYVVPLIPEAINSVLGAEEQRRVDPVLRADDDDSQDIAEAMNIRLNEAWRIHDVNHHCSEAYKPMIIKGLGWLYVGKNSDPMGDKYDIHTVPTTEMIYDKRSRRMDAKDCQFIARRRFLDESTALAQFPEHKKIIKDVYSRFDAWDIITDGGTTGGDGSMYTGIDEQHYMEYLYHRDPSNLVSVYDVYYRAYEKRRIIEHNDGRKEEYDGENSDHVMAIYGEQAITYDRTIPIMRNAWYIGPYLISDEVSPHPHNEYPYVRFQGYQEESTNILYGLVRAMISSQDAYNEANVRQHHLMNTVTVIMDSGALPDGWTDERLLSEVNRADGMIEKNKGYDILIDRHWQQIEKLSQIKQDAREEIRAASGISYSFAGRDVEQKSGVAIASLAEMSSATLAEINSNYQFARRMVARLVMAHENAEIGSTQTEVAVRSETGETRKRITLNGPGEGGGITNALSRAKMQVAMAEAQTAEGYRAQNQQNLKDIYLASPDAIKMDVFQLLIKESNMPGRHEYLAELNRKQGKGATEEEQQKMDQDNAKAQKEEADLVRREREAKIELDLARAANERAGAGQQINQVQDQANAEQAANDADHQAKLQMLEEMRAEIGTQELVA